MIQAPPTPIPVVTIPFLIVTSFFGSYINFIFNLFYIYSIFNITWMITLLFRRSRLGCSQNPS